MLSINLYIETEMYFKILNQSYLFNRFETGLPGIFEENVFTVGRVLKTLSMSKIYLDLYNSI